jgi:nickel transport protein
MSMRRTPRAPIAFALALLTATVGRGHFHMLLPGSPATERDREAAVLYQWGHPFEHQLFDAALPERALLVTPDGKREDLTGRLRKVGVRGEGGKEVAAYRLPFTPERRGDHTLAVSSPPVWMGAEKEFLQDTVKVVVHVTTQNGWDAPAGLPFELVPLTRPYGLRPGVAFQTQALVDGKPLAGAMAEVERYNPAPPKELPPDEQVTARVKADPNGVVTCTLGEPGWWCVAVERDGGTREHDGKAYPLRQRAIFWVFVDEAPAARRP